MISSKLNSKFFLLIGPCKNKINPNNTGGIIVLFENLIEFCNNNKIKYIVIDTNKSNYNNLITAYFSILYQISSKLNKIDYISLHGTAKDYLYLAPFVTLLSKIMNKKYSLRKFAGNFDEFYNKVNFIKKVFIKLTLKNSSANFFETKNLVNTFKNHNKNTYWFPNVRYSNVKPKFKKRFSRKYVFISQLYESKGVDLILNVSNQLQDDYKIDLYGPIKDDKYNANYFKKFKANYCGELPSEEVINTLTQYDILLLPTYYFGEGYPGIIIEAFSVGIPIITTNWRSIPEIVSDKAGFLIEPKNISELKKAILSFNEQNYLQFSKEAYKSFDDFNSEIQNRIFFNKII